MKFAPGVSQSVCFRRVLSGRAIVGSGRSSQLLNKNQGFIPDVSYRLLSVFCCKSLNQADSLAFILSFVRPLTVENRRGLCG